MVAVAFEGEGLWGRGGAEEGRRRPLSNLLNLQNAAVQQPGKPPHERV